MKALSVRAPWWLAILRWGKDIENREHLIASRPPPEVLLHASQWHQTTELCRVLDLLVEEGMIPTTDEDAYHLDTYRERSGGIVGRVKIKGVQRNGAKGAHASRWAVEGSYGLVLAEPVEAPVFVPWPGALGFFEVDAGAYREAFAFAQANPGAPREAFRQWWPERAQPRRKAS